MFLASQKFQQQTEKLSIQLANNKSSTDEAKAKEQQPPQSAAHKRNFIIVWAEEGRHVLSI